MSAPSTDLQRQVLNAMVVLTREKLRRGGGSTVTTRELSARLGRPGQVLGHSCGELTRKGLLCRTDRATYRLTPFGLAWLTHAHRSREPGDDRRVDLGRRTSSPRKLDGLPDRGGALPNQFSHAGACGALGKGPHPAGSDHEE